MLDFDLTVPSLIMVQCQVAQACTGNMSKMDMLLQEYYNVGTYQL